MIKVTYDNLMQSADIDRTGGKNLVDDATLYTSVFLSLFTRRLAASDDVLPDPKMGRQGWWADLYNDVQGDYLGSKLWLLSRSGNSAKTLSLAKQYAEEALQWLVDDGVALSVVVTTSSPSKGFLALKVEITKPANPARRWESVWEAHLALL